MDESSSALHEMVDVAFSGPGLVLRETTEGDSLGILVAGDLYVPTRLLSQRACESHPWASLEKSVREYHCAIVNLECPITTMVSPIVKSGPLLRSDARLLDVVSSGGFGAVSLANNHVLDMGPEGLANTLAACNERGLKVVGAGVGRAEQAEPLRICGAGWSVAVLAVAEAEFATPVPGGPGANCLDSVEVGQAIRKLMGSDCVVAVILHGGNEHYRFPSPRIRRTARHFVDCGASAVVCHHSHVPSGIEIYRQASIVYGTGNFFFPTTDPRSASWSEGYAVGLQIDRAGVRAMRLQAYSQAKNELCIRAMCGSAMRDFVREIGRRSVTIADSAALEAEWRQFCRRRSRDYLSTILGLSRAERRLLRWGVWPWWRRSRRSLPALLNAVRCDSHRDVLVEVLETEVFRDGGFGQS